MGLRDMLPEVVKGRKRRLRKVGMVVKAMRNDNARRINVRGVKDRMIAIYLNE